MSRNTHVRIAFLPGLIFLLHLTLHVQRKLPFRVFFTLQSDCGVYDGFLTCIIFLKFIAISANSRNAAGGVWGDDSPAARCSRTHCGGECYFTKSKRQFKLDMNERHCKVIHLSPSILQEKWKLLPAFLKVKSCCQRNYTNYHYKLNIRKI